MSINWQVEGPLIEVESDGYNVDPAFIMAIRQQENGPDDDPYGVTHTYPNIHNYDDQLRICCISVAHRLASYSGNPLTRGPMSRRLVYSQDWIKYFANIWAPPSADPINSNWLPNVLAFYKHWVTA